MMGYKYSYTTVKKLRLIGLAMGLGLLQLSCLSLWDESRNYPPTHVELQDNFVYYPLDAYLRGIEGRVEVLVRIEETGEVSDTRVTVSSGEASLDSAAQFMASEFHFAFKEEFGPPHVMMVKVPIVFSLEQAYRSQLNLESWLHKARQLRQTASRGNLDEQVVGELELLDHYLLLANDLRAQRDASVNQIILEGIETSLQDSWRDYLYFWPLPFVLFQDFLLRYPQSEYADLAEYHLKDYLQYEIAVLSKSRASGLMGGVTARQMLEQMKAILSERN